MRATHARFVHFFCPGCAPLLALSFSSSSFCLRFRSAVFAFGASQGDVWPRPPGNPRAFFGVPAPANDPGAAANWPY
jgi:hypothetical protein